MRYGTVQLVVNILLQRRQILGAYPVGPVVLEGHVILGVVQHDARGLQLRSEDADGLYSSFQVQVRVLEFGAYGDVVLLT